MLYMFLSGVKMDVSMVNKTGKKAWAIGLVALVAPVAVSFALYTYYGSRLKLSDPREATGVLMVITSEVVTSFPVIATILTELKILNSELGRLALASALTSQLFGSGLILMGKVVQIYLASVTGALITLVSYIAFVLVVIFVIHPGFLWIIKQTPEGKPVKDVYTYLVIMLEFAFVGIGNKYVKFGTIGNFIMGLAVPAGPPLASAIVEKLDLYLMHVLLPLLGTLSAMRADLVDIGITSELTKFYVLITVANFVTKFVVCFLIPKICMVPLKDELVIAFIMSAKGIPEMSAYVTLRNRKVSACMHAFLLFI